MTPEQAIKELFSKMTPQSLTVSVGTVISVDRDKHTCDVERDGMPPLFNCRLNAVVDKLVSYIVGFPKIGSYVLCLSIGEPTDCFVLAMTEIDQVIFKTEYSEMSMSNGIAFNGGGQGGLILIREFTNRINEFVTQFNTHTHPVSGSLASATTMQAMPFNSEDYENRDIKQ